MAFIPDTLVNQRPVMSMETRAGVVGVKTIATAFDPVQNGSASLQIADIVPVAAAR